MVEVQSDSLELRHAATDHATFVVVPARRLFAIDGVGEPRSAVYAASSETLRTADELVRSRIRHTVGVTLRPQPLECAWWRHPEPPSGDDVAKAFEDRSTWHWQQMIEVPAQATDDNLKATIDEAAIRAGRDAPLLHIVEVEEGRSAQILHVGGGADEARSVRALYEAVAAAGLRAHGHLHEIRLADYDRVPEGRGRSILRLPIER
jgi:hypothetical protein